MTWNRNHREDFCLQAQALIPAEVRMISGCEDMQTSADVSRIGNMSSLPDPAGRAGGACTSALLDILYQDTTTTSSTTTSKPRSSSARFFSRKKTPPASSSSSATTPTTSTSFQEVLMQLRETLSKRGFQQIPQLSSSRPLEIQETPFQLKQQQPKTTTHSPRRKEPIDRALLVGINYPGQNGQLSGCHNDVFNMKKYLENVQGFAPENILVLVDDGKHTYPTRGRIMKALQILVQHSRPGDSVFFHYSGHGGLLEPTNNALKHSHSEFDQTLIPVDHQKAGQIRDFSLFSHFIQPMPAGVLVTCVMDCCHSGNVLDLPYSFRATKVGEPPRMVEQMGALANLAFLYTLAGGVLPMGGSGLFDNVGEYLSDRVGSNYQDYQGAGLSDEEAAQDFQADALTYNNDDYDGAGDYGQGGVMDDTTGAFDDSAVGDANLDPADGGLGFNDANVDPGRGLENVDPGLDGQNVGPIGFDDLNAGPLGFDGQNVDQYGQGMDSGGTPVIEGVPVFDGDGGGADPDGIYNAGNYGWDQYGQGGGGDDFGTQGFDGMGDGYMNDDGDFGATGDCDDCNVFENFSDIFGALLNAGDD